jgi:PAS domain S-box-containing protein
MPNRNKKRKIQESEGFMELLINSVPAMIFYLDAEQRYTIYNETFMQWYNVDADEAIGVTAAEFIGEAAYARIAPNLAKAYAGEQVRFEMLAPTRINPNKWLSIVYTPDKRSDGNVTGIIVHATDITESKRTEIALRESEARFRSVFEQAPLGIALMEGREMIITLGNDRIFEIWGKPSTITGLPVMQALPELEGQPFLALMEGVYDTGIPHFGTGTMAKLVRNGVLEDAYFDFVYTPVRNAAGKVTGIMTLATEVTERELANQAIARSQAEQALTLRTLEEKEAVLRNAIELAELGTWSVDIINRKISYSERMQQWLGIEEATMPSGASPRIHPDDGERIYKAFSKAMEKGGTGRFDEVYKINNVITGATRIIHASGITQFDEQGNPVKLSGTAQDVTIQQDLQTKLEQEVQLRTEELGSAIEELQATNEELADANEQLLRSNEELAQYAYVASHDLQEPLRKIQVYASMLTAKKEMPQRSLDLASKIAESSERMRQLILGLLDFSRLLKSDTIYQPVDLNKVVKEVLHDFELVANEKNATFNVDKLPSIEAVGLQMNQLFYNLISNSLKFTKPDVPPVITITAHAATAEQLREHIRTPLPFASYYKICIRDNGIGFEKQYFDQIFEIFKRLHGRETYPGSGIGLALCRRIISNHGGALYTESTPGEGATFCLILPDKQSG